MFDARQECWFPLLSGENGGTFSRSEAFPCAWGEGSELELAYLDAEEPKCRESDGGGHAAHLAVFAFDEGKFDPAGGDVFAEADRRSTFRDDRLRVEDADAAGEGPAAINDDTFFNLFECRGIGHFFDLGPIDTMMLMLGAEEEAS